MNPIGRWEFLEARMAYLAQMRGEGYTPKQMIEAINIGDEAQVKLLLETWDRKVEREPE